MRIRAPTPSPAKYLPWKAIQGAERDFSSVSLLYMWTVLHVILASITVKGRRGEPSLYMTQIIVMYLYKQNGGVSRLARLFLLRNGMGESRLEYFTYIQNKHCEQLHKYKI